MKYKIYQYPNDYLMNLASFNVENINDKIKRTQEDGLEFDCLNCIISLAFSIEAIVNLVGHLKIENWKEKQDFFKKMKTVCNSSTFKFDENIEPFHTLKQLKQLRDNIAHGKPKEKEKSFKIGTPKELKDELEPTWKAFTNPKFTNHAYQMVKKFENDLIEAHGMDLSETGTRAISQ